MMSAVRFESVTADPVVLMVGVLPGMKSRLEIVEKSIVTPRNRVPTLVRQDRRQPDAIGLLASTVLGVDQHTSRPSCCC
jgi:hypothetical protein